MGKKGSLSKFDGVQCLMMEDFRRSHEAVLYVFHERWKSLQTTTMKYVARDDNSQLSDHVERSKSYLTSCIRPRSFSNVSSERMNCVVRLFPQPSILNVQKYKVTEVVCDSL